MSIILSREIPELHERLIISGQLMINGVAFRTWGETIVIDRQEADLMELGSKILNPKIDEDLKDTIENWKI